MKKVIPILCLVIFAASCTFIDTRYTERSVRTEPAAEAYDAGSYDQPYSDLFYFPSSYWLNLSWWNPFFYYGFYDYVYGYYYPYYYGYYNPYYYRYPYYWSLYSPYYWGNTYGYSRHPGPRSVITKDALQRSSGRTVTSGSSRISTRSSGSSKSSVSRSSGSRSSGSSSSRGSTSSRQIKKK